MIKDEGLAAYADLLERNGFSIYEPKRGPSTYFTYSRVVDGRECFGHVTLEYFGGYSHTMPIKPSAQFGSAMVVDGVPNVKNNIGRAELTVEEARTVARPTNRGPFIAGVHENWQSPHWLESGYVKRGTTTEEEK